MATPLGTGDPAPDFTLTQDNGQTVTLSDFAGSKLVLYFYPRADTPGCTREAIAFSALAKVFEASGTRILGVSADEVAAQERFKAKYDLTIPLGSDPTRAALEAYGAYGEKTLYGRKSVGVLRTTYLIDGAGRIAKVWRNVRVDGHADAVLKAAQELG